MNTARHCGSRGGRYGTNSPRLLLVMGIMQKKRPLLNDPVLRKALLTFYKPGDVIKIVDWYPPKKKE